MIELYKLNVNRNILVEIVLRLRDQEIDGEPRTSLYATRYP